jgi:hypothetical protein
MTLKRILLVEGKDDEHVLKHVSGNRGGPRFDEVANIPKGEVRFSKLDEPKAVIHTWLAWQEEPGRPLGTAITARYLDPHVPEVDVLVAWLNRLYER